MYIFTATMTCHFERQAASTRVVRYILYIMYTLCTLCTLYPLYPYILHTL